MILRLCQDFKYTPDQARQVDIRDFYKILYPKHTKGIDSPFVAQYLRVNCPVPKWVLGSDGKYYRASMARWIKDSDGRWINPSREWYRQKALDREIAKMAEQAKAKKNVRPNPRSVYRAGGKGKP